MEIKNISILGGADWKETDQTYQDAFETCKLLAQNGYIILNGGGPGVMRAATDGAHAGGGTVIGVTYYPDYHHELFLGRDQNNRVDQEVTTEDYFDRTKELLILGDCHIVFRGGTGSISEFGMSWASSRIHKGHQIPLVLYGEFWTDVLEGFKEHMYMRSGEFKLYKIVKTPQEVLEFVQGLKNVSTPFSN